jgi:hypothetical protein
VVGQLHIELKNMPHLLVDMILQHQNIKHLLIYIYLIYKDAQMFFETAIINWLILIILNYQVFVHDERF